MIAPSKSPRRFNSGPCHLYRDIEMKQEHEDQLRRKIYQQATEIKCLKQEIERLKAWNAEMVKKAASGGTLDGYREMAQQLTNKDAEIERLNDAIRSHMADNNILRQGKQLQAAEIERLKAENEEQARLLGMSAEREASLRGEVERLRGQLQHCVNHLERANCGGRLRGCEVSCTIA